ncbi:LysR family transcriptional regulator [Lebetimonas sp. JH292]|uniref:LysR family transcriptional regulator n=1 Tax=Lebetimonas sp. JH292 TaxID=990068 RepID=UPI000465D1D0|nr:LysR family transcriptional regulator [Lebetimonas sp. JH292]
MTLKELNIFYELCKYNSPSVVAKRLNVSQSAVSLALKSLEKDLGVNLFNRIGKKLVLNEYGRVFKEKTYKNYTELIDAKHLFNENNLIGEMNIITSKTIGSFVLPKIIYIFKQNYPKISINKKNENSKFIVNSILEGKTDFGFIENEIDNKNIIKEKIGEDRLIIVSSDKKLKKEYFIDELFNKRWILREAGSGTREMFLNAIYDIDLPVFYETNSISEIKMLLKNPDVITCISEYAVKEEIKRGELFKIKIKNLNLKRNFYLVYHKNKIKTKIFEKFSEFIKKNLKTIQ